MIIKYNFRYSDPDRDSAPEEENSNDETMSSDEIYVSICSQNMRSCVCLFKLGIANRLQRLNLISKQNVSKA